MVRVEREQSGWLGITLAAVGGLITGALAGALVGELLGPVNADRVRGTLGRRERPDDDPAPDPRIVQRSVEAALAEDETASALGITARALGEGIVELDGEVASADHAEHVRLLVQAVAGVRVVVNHLTVVGDGPPTQDASAH